MTNYNDGKWHGWNGLSSTCPVHEESLVDVVYAGTLCKGEKAGDWRWEDEFVGAFRVVKGYKEPREWWVNVYEHETGSLWNSKEEAEKGSHGSKVPRRTIKVREVIEDE